MGKRRSWDRQTELRDCCSGAITGVLKHLGECSMGLHNALCCTVRQGLHYYPLKFKWRFQSSFRYKLPVTCVKLLANVKTFWFLFGYSQQFTNLSDFVFNLLTCCNFSKITSIRITSKRIRNIVQIRKLLLWSMKLLLLKLYILYRVCCSYSTFCQKLDLR